MDDGVLGTARKFPFVVITGRISASTYGLRASCCAVKCSRVQVRETAAAWG